MLIFSKKDELRDLIQAQGATIDRQQMQLQQINATLQMFIAEQEISNSEQDDIATDLAAINSGLTRECPFILAKYVLLKYLHVIAITFVYGIRNFSGCNTVCVRLVWGVAGCQ